MEFRIADSFTDSLARLTADEQKAVKTTAFDLQMDPSRPGMSVHRLDKSRDKHFWSVRVNADIRIIIHRTASSLMLCYVDHHDRAYAWAERRKLETHPTTGAAQLVEVRERIEELVVPAYVQQAALPLPGRALLAGHTDQELLAYGVPMEWLADVKQADEDRLLVLADHLPSEAAEALLELAVGGTPRPAIPAEQPGDPFDHPDAQRRFRLMTNVEELERALEFPWEKWTVFLHPEQRQWVERDYAGPARVSGSAGTGKTIVALHRAVHLARANPDARVLLATFSNTLAHALRTKLNRLVYSEPRLAERVDVHSMDALAGRLHKAWLGPFELASRDTVRTLLREAADAIGETRFSPHFLLTEWEQVVDAWQLASVDDYRDVARLGRKTRLPEARRDVLWTVFEQVRSGLARRGLVTSAGLFARLASALQQGQPAPFDHAVVDEAQDIAIAQLRFFAALGTGRPDALFFAGDLGQRIFQQPFSWKSLGVDIRGRSRTLRINYRTSHQIRQQADCLLGSTITDVDGNREERKDTISVFNGPPPEIQCHQDSDQEATAVGNWIGGLTRAGFHPREIGVFVRSPAQLVRAEHAVAVAGLGCKVLDDNVELSAEGVAVCTMHLAKGLEFRAVAVMACDDEVVPLQARIDTIGDDADLQDVYDTERHLLYVACTRARERLLLSGVEPASEFFDDMAR